MSSERRKISASFTCAVHGLLEHNGFHVNSNEEAYYCMKQVLEAYVAHETLITTGGTVCPNCNHISGTKNIGPVT